MGGGTSPYVAISEVWNGSSWTEVADLNTGRGEKLGGAGTTTDAVAFGGGDGSASTKTETYNGTSWAEGGDLANAITSHGGCGTATLALCFGGWNLPGAQNNTEERSYSHAFKKVTTG